MSSTGCMTRLLLGTNTIENCDNALVIAGTPLFSYRKADDKPSISFRISSPPASMEIDVRDNIVHKGNVIVDIDAISSKLMIKLGDRVIMNLSLRDDEAIVNLDLRPLGLLIFTDHQALHIGGSQLSQNTLKECTNAIVVG